MNSEEFKAVHSFHHGPLDAQRCVRSAPLPEINNHLFGIVYVEGEIAVCAPVCEEFHLITVRSLVVSDEVLYRCIVGELDDGVGVELGNAVVGVEGVECG